MKRVGKKNIIGDDAGWNGVGGEGSEDVSGGARVGQRAGNVGMAGEGHKVVGSSVVRGEVEEEGVVSGGGWREDGE